MKVHGTYKVYAKGKVTVSHTVGEPTTCSETSYVD